MQAPLTPPRKVLNIGVGRLLREIRDELGALARIIDGVVDDVELPDRYGADSSYHDDGWYLALRARWADDERRLRASLADGVGADIMAAAPFSLAGSLVTVPLERWQQVTRPPNCEPFGDGRFYRGGGALRGPDGLYPIVVPHLVTDTGHYTADGSSNCWTPTVTRLPSAATLGGQC